MYNIILHRIKIIIFLQVYKNSEKKELFRLLELLETVEFRNIIGDILINVLMEKCLNESEQIDIEESSL